MENQPTTSIHVYNACPVCQSDKISKVLSAIDHTVSTETFEVWHCEECRHRFTQHIPVESEIGRYYQSDEYISHSNTSKGLINSLYQAVRNYTLGQKRKLVQKISGRKDGKILDIGCGTGEFLGTMKKAGWETLGLEPDEGARQQAIDNQGIEVKASDELYQLTENQFEVVSMWHVLEHVHRLHENIEQVHKILKDKGILIIAVPNYNSKDADHYQAEWAAYDVPRHLYHFCANSMTTLLSQHGFALRKMSHMPFDGFYVSMLSEKYRHGKVRLVAAFFQGLRSFLQSSFKSERGSSIMYIFDRVDK